MATLGQAVDAMVHRIDEVEWERLGWAAACLAVSWVAVQWLFGAVSAKHRVGSEFYTVAGPDASIESRKRFLVSNATSRQGRAVVKRLVQQGLRVLAADKNYKRLKSIASREGWLEYTAPNPKGRDSHLCELKPLDPASCSDWQSAARFARTQFGGLDVFINVVESLDDENDTEEWTNLTAMSEEDVEIWLDRSVKGCAQGIRILGKLMGDLAVQGDLPHWGHIVIIGSLAGGDLVRSGTKARYQNVVDTAICCLVSSLPSESGFYTTFVGRDPAPSPSSNASQLTAINDAIFDLVLPRRPRKVIVVSFLKRSLLSGLHMLRGTRLAAFFLRATSPFFGAAARAD